MKDKLHLIKVLYAYNHRIKSFKEGLAVSVTGPDWYIIWAVCGGTGGFRLQKCGLNLE